MKEIEEIKISVAKLETALEFTLKQNEKLDEKLDLVLVNINKLNSEREADLYTLRFSIKKKINESIAELKSYHDNDLAKIKVFVERTKWTLFPRLYPKATVTIAVLLLLSIIETFWEHRETIKEFLEYFNPLS